MPVLTTATILVLQIQNQKISTQVRTSVHGVSASHECAARRCTHWHHVIVVKHHTTVCQGVNVGRRHLVRPMETDVVPTLQQHQVYPSKIPHKQTYMSVSWTAFKLTCLYLELHSNLHVCILNCIQTYMSVSWTAFKLTCLYLELHSNLQNFLG